MRTSTKAGAALALLTVACASPIELDRLEPRAGLTFSIDQSVPKPFILSGPASMSKTYGKFGKQAPADVQAAAASQTGVVTASPEQYDSEYLCPVSVGGQTLNLDFDTGSSDLWVFSTELPTSERTGHSLYNPSTGVKETGETWSISYGDGSGASGNIYADTVVIGGATATSQAVEAATSVSTQFVQDTDNDGLVGLAFDSINTASPNQVKTFFTTVGASLKSKLFTANLKKGAPGKYDFGFIDTTQYTGSISYTSVKTTNGFWEFTGSGYAVGSGSFVSSSIDGIADTGTTLLYLPSTIVSAYYAKVPGASYNSAQGGYIFTCGTTLPSITLGIGSYRAVVPGSYIQYAPISGSTCFGGIQRNTGIGFSIYGDIFLKSQFVVFDETTSAPRLGFAAKPT